MWYSMGKLVPFWQKEFHVPTHSDLGFPSIHDYFFFFFINFFLEYNIHSIYFMCCCCSAAQLCPTLCDLMNCSRPGPSVLQQHPELAQTHILRWWCHQTISSSVIPFSSCLWSFPESGCFPMSQFFTSGDQGIGVSASASVFPMNILGWFPLRLTGLVSFQSRGLSRVFSSTTVGKHQFFRAQPSLWSNSHIFTWLLEKPQLWLYGSLSAK